MRVLDKIPSGVDLTLHPASGMLTPMTLTNRLNLTPGEFAHVIDLLCGDGWRARYVAGLNRSAAAFRRAGNVQGAKSPDADGAAGGAVKRVEDLAPGDVLADVTIGDGAPGDHTVTRVARSERVLDGVTVRGGLGYRRGAVVRVR